MGVHRQLRLGVFVTALMVVTLILPMAASAGGDVRQTGSMVVPAGATMPYTLTVGRVSVTIPPEAMPQGGVVSLRVIETPSGRFIAEFLPNCDFEVPVTMDYDTAPWVEYHLKGQKVRIPTDEGKIESSHFSRYSGWF